MQRDVIEQALARWTSPIPAGLGDRFDDYHRRHSLRFLLVINLLGQAAYFAYLGADVLLIPDVAFESALVRGACLLATLPLQLALFRWSRNVRLLDLLVPALTLPAALLWFELLLRSRSPAVATYLYASLVFIVLANLSVRVRFLPALGMSLLISAATLTGVVRLSAGATQPVLVFALVFLPVLLFSLFISWSSTYHGRRAFLRSVLDEMNREELVRANQRLQALADTDGLTGIANRRRFDDQARHFWRRAQHSGQSVALLLLDIDHFKPYNDHYGHQAGDDCLVRVAQVIAAHMRDGEYFAGRYGGEEFAVILGPAGPAQVQHVAQRLVAAVQQLDIAHARRPDDEARLTLSVGAALSSEAGVDTLDDLLRCSDLRLYEAKRRGRNRAVVSPVPVA